MALAPATDDDWAAMFGTPAPAAWLGLVERTPWLVQGIGVAYRGVDGRWWLGFQRASGIRKVKTAHAAARRLLAEAQAHGITLHALADPDKPGSVAWIERLGFRRTEETMGGIAVWTR